MRTKTMIASATAVLLQVSTPVLAQTATPPPGAARESAAIPDTISNARDVAIEALDETAPTLAAGGRDNRILSQNDIYNLGRAAEGRVGLRVGSDMSFRVEKRAGEPR